MSIRRTIVLGAPLVLALSACDSEPEVDVEDDGREASGEVLEGTISDAMLPLDKVRSQAPRAVEVEEAEDAGGTGTPPETDATDAEDQTEDDNAEDAGAEGEAEPDAETVE